ncbi:MAG: hypothetical protein AB1798_07870, partial [Spirochaetota bacterium]
YLFKLINTKGTIYTNHFSGGSSEDFIAFDFLSSFVKFFNNTVIMGEGSRVYWGFKITDDSGSGIINNILLRKTDIPAGSAFVMKRSSEVEILSNNIFGWSNILETEDKTLKNSDDLNKTDGLPFGGNVNGNVSESFTNTFKVSKTGELTLNEVSLCVDGGYDVRIYGGPDTDWQGQKRPNPNHGLRPAYDIGADEFY